MEREVRGDTAMASFVVRFTQEPREHDDYAASAEGARWRVLVRHIQSGEERVFPDFDHAAQFIQERVDTSGRQRKA